MFRFEYLKKKFYLAIQINGQRSTKRKGCDFKILSHWIGSKVSCVERVSYKINILERELKQFIFYYLLWIVCAFSAGPDEHVAIIMQTV